jgi:AraC-like DNA-binding protein
LPEYDDLTELGFDLGFSSHSHFTSAFRETFGRTPSELRSLLDEPAANKC